MLDNYNFKSVFKEELNNFIKYKRSLGYDYQQELLRLKIIDNILYNLKVKKKVITKDIWLKLTKRKEMKEANYARQYGVTKDFCLFLISNDYKNIYYENKKFHIINNYKPVLFTDNEIAQIFSSIDEFVNGKCNNKYYRTYYSYSIIIRLMYACGLREIEVLRLNYEDINFNESTINIIDSKRHVSRLVVMSISMKQCLINYVSKFNITNGMLFKNINNNIIQARCVKNFYKSILININLNFNSHLHDLRHLFCNKAFNQMLEKGYDENTVIVYLYKYMGHKTIKDTEYYLHFIDYNKQKIISNNDNLSKHLYEGVDLDNE